MQLKKVLSVILATGIVISISSEIPTQAAAKSYKNCTELNKDYKGGVAKDSTVKNKGGETKYKPHVSASLYKANKSKDRDKDGIACEK